MRLLLPLSLHTVLVFTFVLSSSLGAVAQANYVPPRITQAVDENDLVLVRGNTHPLARPENDRGAAPDSLLMERMLLVLQRGKEQEAALRRLLNEQQIKSSTRYHRWLTPEQFGEEFGPADSDIQAVTDWLADKGFQVVRVAAGRTVIEFSGTAGLVREAFHAEIHKFSVNGTEHWANTSDPQIPAALAPVVAGVASLNNFPRKPLYHRLGTFMRTKSTGEVRPLFTYIQSLTSFYAVGPTDFATIYNVLPLWNAGIDGTGQSIAVVGQSNIHLSDVQDFRSMFGLPANDPQVVLNGPDPGITKSDEGEADLDVQWAGAVAKNATIKFVVSESTESSAGIDLSALYVVDNNLAPVLSNSYGDCESALGTSGNAFYNALWEQAAAQGITVIVSAGDNGSAACDGLPNQTAAQSGLAVSGLASTPFNVALGGTDFNDAGAQSQYWNSTNSNGTNFSAKSYIPEETWNVSCARLGLTGCTTVQSDGSDIVAGSGGRSSLYSKPSWQTGPGLANESARDIPDVSLFAAVNTASNSFYIACQADANTGTGSSTTSCNLSSPYTDFQGVGGTSASAPAFAGIMALVNQKTGSRQGNANYVLYPLAAQSGASCTSNSAAVTNSSCVFYDVTVGNNSVACQGGSPNCSKTTSGGYGILVVNPSASPQVPAWNTAAGFDLGTGLGSVNAANLVGKWTSVSFTPTTTTITSLSPTTLTHGQSVSVAINVTAASGTPTGQVGLLGSGGPSNVNLGIGDFTLSSGAVSGSTMMLPGGTFGVTAHYAGDGAFAASDSTPPITVTVNPEASKTKVSLVTFDLSGNVTSSNATTAGYGSPYIVRVDVTNSSGQACYSANGSLLTSCPTGQVTLTGNGQPLPNQGASSPGAYALNSQGYLEDAFVQFPAGSYSLAASYAGDNSFQPSMAAPDAISITPAVTTATVTAMPSNAAPGANVTLTANVSSQSSGVAPGGTVQFLNGSTPLSGTVTYTAAAGSSTGAFASLQAKLTTTFSATASITAQYSGDSNYASAASPAITVTVSVPPDFSLSAKPSTISISAPGQTGTSVITVTPANGFTGAVNFSCTIPPAMKEANCSFSAMSVTTTGNTTLTVSTTAPHSSVGFGRNPNWFGRGGVVILVGVLLLLGTPARRRRLRLVLSLAVLALLAAAFAGCGGGGSNGGSVITDPGTPAGTYTVTVTGKSGSLSHNTNVTVNVV